MKTPSIGREVHYVLDQGPNRGKHRPATIVEVGEDGKVDLCIKTNGAKDQYDHESWKLPPVINRYGVAHDEGGAPGSWHWPEWVPQPQEKQPGLWMRLRKMAAWR